MGVAYAFEAAGASAVVGTLWSVQDNASLKFASKFYDRLRDNLHDPAHALAASQRDLIESGGRFASPSVWAPYILYGR